MTSKSSFKSNNRAVSPVIGVILMVAITVILAAVIGTFVLGLGQEVSNTTPQASVTFENDPGEAGNISIIHEGGDTIPANTNVTAGGYDMGELGSTLGPGQSTSFNVTLNNDKADIGNQDVTIRLVDEETGNLIAKGDVDL